jgi:D-amino-acid oxidase
MYIRSPKRIFKDTTYVFPRGSQGGIILGGCRMDGNWNGEPDMEFADDIIRRCVELVPGLGTVEEVKGRVLLHGVGLRREFFSLTVVF